MSNPNTRQGMIYAVCPVVLVLSAVLYPLMCLGAVRGRGRVIAALGAVIFGSASLLSGAILSGVRSWCAPVSLCYFGSISIAISIYTLARIMRSAAEARASAGPPTRSG